MNRIIFSALLIAILNSCGYSQKENSEKKKTTVLYENNNEFTKSNIKIILLNKEILECDSVNKIQILDDKNTQFNFSLIGGSIELKDTQNNVFELIPSCKYTSKKDLILSMSIVTNEGEMAVEMITLINKQ